MILIQKSGKHLHKYSFKIPSKDFITKEGLTKSIGNFFTEFEKGKVKPFLKSEVVPDPMFSEGIYKLVGKSFKSFIDSATEPVVIFFYYSFKEEDLAFAHDFTSLANEYRMNFNSNVRFGIICMYRNELAHFFDHSATDNYSSVDYPKKT